ncbi:hypothetical protein HY641_05030 [Candidatus Woesearchaeota archaeon]|nr:hypothetical protein [Candidatus Woesearchaeota archaeon]
MARKTPKLTPNGKRKLTGEEEFEIMKLVLDKVLWVGFGTLLYGLYVALNYSLNEAGYYFLAGAVVLLVFSWIIVKEYEFVRY